MGGRHAFPITAVVVMLALLVPRGARGQISPGPLAKAHQALDGNLQCFKCHVRGSGPEAMSARCLDCHREIRWMVSQRRGLHARVGEQTCASCHPDHGGRDFQLVAWKEGSAERFDHHRTGYALEGKHAEIQCRECHTPKHQRSPAVALLELKDHGRSWLGLERDCVACHQDPHRGQLDRDCRKCHDTRAWKPASEFDHQRSRYPLTGAHVQVKCAKCHLAPRLELAHDAGGAPVPQYRPLPFAECSACHRDPHQKRFGPACAKCHATSSFHTITESGFNHDLTRYPLRGKHAHVKCASCHDPKKAWGKKPAFATCGACHQDPHNKTATLAGRAVDCAECHGVAGFHPSTFKLAAHQKSDYPLEGAHARAACDGCHAKQPAATVAKLGSARIPIRPRHARCSDCHADPHRERLTPGRKLAARPRGFDPDGCRTCHDLEAFRPSRVDVAAHGRYSFPLEAAHRAVPCVACHAELKAKPPSSTLIAAARTGRPLLFREKAKRCDDCHETPHGKQFATRRDRGACDACHGVDAFAPASRFNHDRDSKFKLAGAHARTRCASCHPSERDARGRRFVVYRPVPSRCEDCHTEMRGGRTSSRGGGLQ